MGFLITRQLDRARLLGEYLPINTKRGIEKAERERRDADTPEERQAARDLIARLEASLEVLKERPELLGPNGVGPLPVLKPLEELALIKLSDKADEDTEHGTVAAPGGTREVYVGTQTLGALMGGRDRTRAGRTIASLEEAGILIRTGESMKDVPIYAIADVVPPWEAALVEAGVVLVDRYGDVLDQARPKTRHRVHKHMAWDTEAGNLVEFDDHSEFNEFCDIRANQSRERSSETRARNASNYVAMLTAVNHSARIIEEVTAMRTSESNGFEVYMMDPTDPEVTALNKIQDGERRDGIIRLMAKKNRSVLLDYWTIMTYFPELAAGLTERRAAEAAELADAFRAHAGDVTAGESDIEQGWQRFDVEHDGRVVLLTAQQYAHWLARQAQAAKDSYVTELLSTGAATYEEAAA